MARIHLNNIRHSYLAKPSVDEDFALKKVDMEWEDGGAYALLGSSGCGKTTMLNLISGLLTPSEGKILFDGNDVTQASTVARNIAQVFQFPVVYDTMTVRQNLEFPLKNRGVPEAEIRQRVTNIADMLDLTDRLDTRAAGLTADGKQKISLGRGLVRSDVNAILFDEPLTVIDPHLKWQLRSKLKELHEQFGATMIYVTHDQTEALTFADQVVVMHDGMVVQTGTPVELFEKPLHTFVGNFIGSPGMNVLKAKTDNQRVLFGDTVIDSGSWESHLPSDGNFEIGIRPEFVSFSDQGIEARIDKVSDIGRLRIVNVTADDQPIKIVLSEGEEVPSGTAHIKFDSSRVGLFVDSWLRQQGASA